MKLFKRSLAVILTLCMVLGVVPFTAFASESTSAYSSATFDRIVHLDCGRKYFTADWIKALINEMAAAGYTQLQLAFGNDGLRFLLDDMSVTVLDDMSVTVNGTTYSDDNVTAGVQAGNNAYYDAGDVNELTESEMDEIITHAQIMGIEIVPHLNMPGHMDAVLDAIEYVGIKDAHFTGYTTSVRSLNLNNPTAVAFAKALLQKYVDYFDAKGCKYFHIGADEFGNDAYGEGAMGFPRMGSTLYTKFASFVNDCADIVKKEGMTPRAWNDGISYTRYNASFDTDIQITYWSSGWGGYNVASASTLSKNGHDMINTNGDYYYILGVNDCYTVDKTTNHVGYDYTAAKSFSNTAFMGSTISDPAGSMFCIWGDVPSAETETEVAKYIRPILRVMAARMNDTTSYEVDSIVTGGFNADGTINANEVYPSGDVTLTENYVSITAENLTGLTVTKTTAAIEGAAEGKVAAWNITPATADGAYTGSAVVSIPVPADWNNVRGGVMTSANGAQVLGITGTRANGVFTFEVPHFSTVVVYEAAPAAVESKEVAITVGQTSQTYTDNSGYYTTVEGLNTAVATATLGGNEAVTATVKYDKADVSCADLISENGKEVPTDFYIEVDGEKYPLYMTRTSKWYVLYTEISYTYHYSTDGGKTIVQYGNTQTTNSTLVSPQYDVYRKSGTEAVPAQTTVSFTGVSAGTTTATIGNTTYKITVSKKTESVTITTGNTKTYTDNSTTAVSSNSSVATAAINNGKLTITAVAIGYAVITTDSAVYNVTVMAEDISKVDPVQVEWWITNIPVEATDGTVADGYNKVGTHNIPYSEIEASDAYGVNGAALADFVPETAKWGDVDSLKLWKGTRLLDENRQTDSADADQTAAGDDYNYIRYYEGKWWVSYDRSTWLAVNADDQLVAYYLQKQQITPEIDILFKDWGYVKAEGAEDTASVALSVAVVYPDGTISPSEDTIYPETSIIFNYSSNRNIGIVAPENNSIYNISKITVTNGKRDQKNTTQWYSTNTVTWEKATNEAGSEWFNERTVWTSNPDNKDANDGVVPMVNGAANQDNVIWSAKNTAILVLIYLEPVHYENNLKVQWVDDNAQESIIHEIEVNVSSDNEQTNFYDELKQTSALPTEGTGGTFILDDDAYVTNTSDVNQTFNKDITVMHDVAAQYKSGLYMYVGAELNADGTVLTLHYNVNPKKLAPMYVIDFGLKIEFPVTDLVKNYQDIKSLEITEAPIYGTAVMSSSDKDGIITYTPTRILQAIDVIRIDVTFVNNEKATVRVGIAPATTVYYEEGFLFTETDNLNGWSFKTSSSTKRTQDTEKLGAHKNNYGYDPYYANSTSGSDNSCAVATVTDGVGAYTSFTFTGTGFELYANSDNSSGIVTVLKQGGGISKLYRIDTVLNPRPTVTGYTLRNNAPNTYYSLPIISETDLDYGTYTVQIKQNNTQTAVDENDAVDGKIYIDGVRIINTVDQTGKTGKNNIYFADKEDSPDFYELRDYVLKALKIDVINASDYICKDDTTGRVGMVNAVEKMAGQVYDSLGVATDTTVAATAVVLTNADALTDEEIQDLLDNGPKNELYLRSGQSLTFKVTTNRVMQLGLKSPVGNAKFTLTVQKAGDENATKLDLDAFNGSENPNTTDGISSLTSTVDMFYEIAGKAATAQDYTVTITVNSGLLSVTKLKICDDPNAAFVALTQEDIENALLGIYGLTDDKTPVEPEEPAAEADAVLAITLTDGKKDMGTAELTAVGAEGESHTFTAEEILNAVLDVIPDLYKVADESAITDIAVKYGETGKITVDVELEFDFDMDSWWRQVKNLMNQIYTIIANAGEGGSITNEGSADVKFRKDITYTITPDEGYEIESVIVDGKDVGAVSEYTFRRVRNDHRISVVFREVQ